VFAISEFYLGFVNQRENYGRLKNVGTKTDKNIVNKYEGICFANRYKIPFKIIIFYSVVKKSFSF
jgi:hypothetical protein